MTILCPATHCLRSTLLASTSRPSLSASEISSPNSSVPVTLALVSPGPCLGLRTPSVPLVEEQQQALAVPWEASITPCVFFAKP